MLQPSNIYHHRISLQEYDAVFSEIQERDFNQHDVTSPFDAWSTEKLRAKVPPQEFEKSLVDIVLWGRGEPRHPAATKIGGVPAWPSNHKLPSQKQFSSGTPEKLYFLGQLNFADSRDILPAMPGDLLSIWVTAEFPCEEESVVCYWVPASQSVRVTLPAKAVASPLISGEPFFASLVRTWDPPRYHLFEKAEVDHQFASRRFYEPEPWKATKFGGIEALPQGEVYPSPGTFIAQLFSIQPAHEVQFPWVNKRDPLDLSFSEGGIYAETNQLMLGDMGALGFFLDENTLVVTEFACG